MQCSVRSEADGKRLQAEFGDFFTPLVMDITDEAAVRKAAAEVKGLMKGRTLMGLVNNAGKIISSLPGKCLPAQGRQDAGILAGLILFGHIMQQRFCAFLSVTLCLWRMLVTHRPRC